MLRKLFFTSLALVSACSITTDLDGLSGGPRSPDASDGGREAGNPDPAPPVEAGPVCAAGQDFTADPKNCGACGHDCLGGGCLASACQAVTLSTAITSSHIRLDADYAYFADEARAIVSRVPKRGGPEEILAEQQNFLYELAVNDTHVYYMADQNIRRVPKTGGAPQNVVTASALQYIVLTADTLYWATFFSGLSNGTINRAALDGSNPSQIVKDRTGTETFAIDGDQLFYGENGQTSDPGSVRVYNLATGDDKVVADAAPCRRLVIDKDNVFFLDFNQKPVFRVPRSGGAPTPIATSAREVFDSDIALDGTYIYWAVKNTPGGVFRVAKTGGTVTTISSTPNATAVAVDEKAVYWTIKDVPGVYYLAK